MQERQHVLVAMREHSLRRILAGALRCTGFDVVEAFDDADAIDEIVHADRPFDAILRDGRRDPEAVLDALSRIRHADAEAPVLLLVGRTTHPAFAGEARRLGAELLGLPITATELRALLATLPSRSLPAPEVEEPVFVLGPEHVSAHVAAAPKL